LSIIISDQTTWPTEVISYLEKNHHRFVGWETPVTDRVSAHEFDQAIFEFRRLLKPFSLVGYHCTKLTPYEIQDTSLSPIAQILMVFIASSSFGEVRLFIIIMLAEKKQVTY